MSRLPFRKAMLVVAGTLSLVAQGLLFIPTVLASLSSSHLWKSAVLGGALFALSILLFIAVLSPQFIRRRREWRTDGILLATQVFTVLGIYFLLDGVDSGERGVGFLLGSLITTLTTYGIFAHTTHVNEAGSQPDRK